MHGLLTTRPITISTGVDGAGVCYYLTKNQQ